MLYKNQVKYEIKNNFLLKIYIFYYKYRFINITLNIYI